MSDLVVRKETGIVVEARDLKAQANLIRSFVQSGNKQMTDMQAMQLAFISMTTGLNFMTGELYMTDTGPQIGVLAYERKAQEILEATLPGTNYHLAYRKALAGEDADFDPDKGDIGYVCILTRDDWDAEWQKRFSEYLTMFKDAGFTGAEAVKEAKSLAGKKPSMEYVGVVDHRESFSGEYYTGSKMPEGVKAGDKRPEMMDRHERAKKRARKGVLKHAFPRMDIPDPIEVLRRSNEKIAEAMALRDVTPAHADKPSDVLLAEITGGPASNVIIEPEPQRPYTPEQLKERMNQVANTHAKLSEGALKALPGNLDGLFLGGDGKERHVLCKWLFGHTSTKNLTPGQAYALSKWMDYKETDGDWVPDMLAVQEAQAAYAQAMKDSGQMSMELGE